MSCLRPSLEGCILRDFNPVRHTVQGWIPTGGMIFSGIDWGGDEPHHPGGEVAAAGASRADNVKG